MEFLIIIGFLMFTTFFIAVRKWNDKYFDWESLLYPMGFLIFIVGLSFIQDYKSEKRHQKEMQSIFEPAK